MRGRYPHPHRQPENARSRSRQKGFIVRDGKRYAYSLLDDAYIKVQVEGDIDETPEKPANKAPLEDRWGRLHNLPRDGSE